jgi:hypothetical protein
VHKKNVYLGVTYSYPQIFRLEDPLATTTMATFPDRDLCGDGDVGTGETPPCEACPDPMPYTYLDRFDYFWPEDITALQVILPDGSPFPTPNDVVRVSGNRLRVNFCSAPPCFSIVLNNQCTVLAFERADCPGEPCPGPPPDDDIDPPPPPGSQSQAGFVQFRHENLATGVQFATSIPGLSEARYRYVQYPSTPRDYLASSMTGAGGSATDHIGPSATPMLVRADITDGLSSFVGWRFETNPAPVLGFTLSGNYSPAPLPPTFTIGGPSAPAIGFLVPPGTEIIAIAQFGQIPPPAGTLAIGIGNTGSEGNPNRGQGFVEFPAGDDVVAIGFGVGVGIRIMYFSPVLMVVQDVMATVQSAGANTFNIAPTFAAFGAAFFANVDIKIRILSGPSAGTLIVAGSTVSQTILATP